MPGETYHWHYDYARLAWDSGFCFENSKSKATLNRNEIGVIDIERIIKERDVAIVERHLQTVVECRLDEEQLQILEPSFAKLFRLSQLAVEYLLYCKQYLDHTVVLLKKELYAVNEKNSKFKNQLEQRDGEIMRLRKKVRDMKDTLNLHQNVLNQQNPTMQVQHQRSENTLEENFRLETDKLQSEIKELKEKLNSKERFYNENVTNSGNKSTDSASVRYLEPNKMNDLQKQFDLLKEYVRNELKQLQSQKHETEKLDEWGQMLIQKITETSKQNTISCATTSRARRNSETQTETTEKENKKKLINSGTDPIEPKSDSSASELKTKNDKSNNDKQILYSVVKKVQEEIENKNDSNFDKLEQVLEKKVTNTIETFQDKMQAFWNKLEEIETKQSSKIDEITQKIQQKVVSVESKKTPPKISASSSDSEQEQKQQESFKKLTPKQMFIVQKKKKEEITESETDKPALQKVVPPKQIVIQQRASSATAKQPILLKQSKMNKKKSLPQVEESSSSQSSSSEEEVDDEEESDSESVESAENEVPLKLQPSTTTISTLGQKSITSLKEALSDTELKNGLKEELNDLLKSRLRNLGVSPDWKSLPHKSYKNVHDIIMHKAKLNSKQFDSYWKVQKNILATLEEIVNKNSKKEKTKPKPIKPSQKPQKSKEFLKPGKPVAAPRKNLILTESVQKPKSQERTASALPSQLKVNRQQNAVKERAKTDANVENMYKTDSDSDELENKNPTNKIKTLPKEVLRELKEKHEIIRGSLKKTGEFNKDDRNKENDNTSINSDILDQKDVKQKSNLKNYPSYGSLVKKKVIFDMDKDESLVDALKIDEGKAKPVPTIKIIDNISSSSVDSTVLDGSKTNLLKVPSPIKNAKKTPISDDENLDWDISDILC